MVVIKTPTGCVLGDTNIPKSHASRLISFFEFKQHLVHTDSSLLENYSHSLEFNRLSVYQLCQTFNGYLEIKFIGDEIYLGMELKSLYTSSITKYWFDCPVSSYQNFPATRY